MGTKFLWFSTNIALKTGFKTKFVWKIDSRSSKCIFFNFKWSKIGFLTKTVAGLSPGHKNLLKPLGGNKRGPCEIVYDWRYKNWQKSVSFSGHIWNGLSMVLVRAEWHNAKA